MSDKAIDMEKAKAAIQAEKQDRMKKCSEALEKVLQEHRCNIQISIVISQHGNVPQIQLIPQD